VTMRVMVGNLFGHRNIIIAGIRCRDQLADTK
jgi:hypothetical protein